MTRTPLLVYSHLRWDQADRRPQQVASRLAVTRPVLYVEEPLCGATTDHWERREITRGLTVHRPHLATVFSGMHPVLHPEEHERFVALLDQLAAHEGIGRHTAWLDTPLAFPAAHALAPEVVVYDCMEDLANIRHAPIEIAETEHRLLRQADLVFTSEPRLERARQGRNGNVHCIPDGVDAPSWDREVRAMNEELRRVESRFAPEGLLSEIVLSFGAVAGGGEPSWL